MEDRVMKYSWDKDATYALKYNKFILWPLGLWPIESNDLFSWFRVVFSCIAQLWIIGTQTTAILLVCGDASALADYVMLLICGILALTKIFAFRIHTKQLRDIFESALKDWSAIESKKNRESLMPFVKTARTVYFFQFIFNYAFVVLMILGTLPLLVPPIVIGTSWDNESVIEMRELPLKTGCMFGCSKIGIYSAIYVYEVFAAVAMAFGNVGSDVVLFSSTMHLCGQIELLKMNISKIGSKAAEDFKEPRERIVTSIQRFDRLLDLISAWNETISGMLIVQLVTVVMMTLMQGIRMLLLLKNGDPIGAVKPLIGLTVLLLQLYQVSYASDRLSQQAESVFDALYDCHWYELPVKLRQNIYFMAMRAKKPIYFTAGQFYVMNLENFKNVLKASFSYFSIIQVMFDG